MAYNATRNATMVTTLHPRMPTQIEPAEGGTRLLRVTMGEHTIHRSEGIVPMMNQGADIGMTETKIDIAPALRTTQRITTAANKTHLAIPKMIRCR